MNATKLTYFLAMVMALSLSATGCKHKPVGVTNLPPNGGTRVPNGADRFGNGLAARPGDGVDGSPGGTDLPTGLTPENSIIDRTTLAPNTVHFDYDSTAIRSGERGNVSAVADYLKSHAGVGLLVEGHCDERGTEEYNRALGERRALALREALTGMGADGGRIITRTYGKDRKLDTGNSEAAHAKNRRGEFVVLTPK